MFVAWLAHVEHSRILSVDEAMHRHVVLAVEMETTGDDDVLQRSILYAA